MDQRSKNFTFTHNNYPNTDLQDALPCKYMLYGKECGDSGTPHLQGLVVMKSQTSLRSMIKKLPGCHVEICKSLDGSIVYCKKDNDFTERGIAPATQIEKGKKEKRKWGEIRQAAEEGRLDDIPEDIRFRCPHLIDIHRQKYLRSRPLVDTETEHLWYYGKSGTGKSRKAREDNPKAFLKTCNKWWCGYQDEESVIIEDLDKKHDVLVHHLKIWADRYPFPAEVKGGSMKIRPKQIIVTSNYHPTDIWTDESDLEPILRRFKIHHFSTISN